MRGQRTEDENKEGERGVKNNYGSCRFNLSTLRHPKDLRKKWISFTVSIVQLHKLLYHYTNGWLSIF